MIGKMLIVLLVDGMQEHQDTFVIDQYLLSGYQSALLIIKFQDKGVPF